MIISVEAAQEMKELLLGVRRDCMEAINALNLAIAIDQKKAPRAHQPGCKRVRTLRGS